MKPGPEPAPSFELFTPISEIQIFMTVSQRVEALRTWMSRQTSPSGAPLAAYIVPTSDPHNDEYIPARWMCREWLTGFTGSAGLAVVTAGKAALWTDSRYWLQASEQLSGTPFVLMREGEPEVPTPAQWLADELQKLGGDCCAACPADMLSQALAEELAQQGAKVESDIENAFDTLWTNRPGLPAEPVTVQPLAYTGLSVADKMDKLRNALQALPPHTDYIFNDLSDVAWALNLRGRDIPYNPVFLAYLVYAADQNRFLLFTHGETLTGEAALQLRDAGVEVHPYEEAQAFCRSHKVASDGSLTLHMSTPDGENLTLPSPAATLRAVKNEAEREGFRLAMLRDGVAMVKFLRRLDEQMERGEEVTELDVDEQLTALRAAQSGFEQLSFGTIAGFAAHGAIVHYEADAASNAKLQPRSFLLLDSGAQFDCGTTDITRTIPLGELSEEEVLVYTLVLQGHLALSRQHFPEGTTGLQLDLAARHAIWNKGYDFGHGTGHGVGSHLCVHEGPHQIRKNVRACTLLPLQEGMTVTNEPGVYVAGRFGVRIENVLLCVAAEETPFGRFLRFETLTLCPYDLRAVKLDLLNKEEIAQLNAYHEEVRTKLLPLLDEEADRAWLRRATEPVEAP